MLYLVGIGLNDEKDITIRGLEIVKKCKYVYLENYTSVLQVSKEKIEEFYGKEIIFADRELVEKNSENILDKAAQNDVAFLVVGDVFGATTHVDLVLRAEERNIKVDIVHNSSILNVIGVTGLSLYNFGKTTSITFKNDNLKTPLEVLKMNRKNGLHTLFLLDIDVVNNKFFSINEACEYLIKNGVEELGIGCAALGNKNQEIKVGKISELINVKYKLKPQCLIIPGKMHFMEEEALERWK